MENNIQIVDQKPASQAIAIQNTSPIMQLADKLAAGTITAEQMEKMLDVQIRWEKNEAEKAYHTAMALFHEDAPEILKTKDGHNCKYAGLSDIVYAVAPKLSDQGLSHTWITETVESGVKVTCKITHVMGHSEETSMVAGPDGTGSKNAIQALGSTVTYLQRYTLKAALGIAEGDQDDDGNASGKGANAFKDPTKAQWECIDAILAKLPPKKGHVIDRTKLSLFFLREKRGKYPSTKKMIVKAAEFVVRSGNEDMYIPVA